MAARKPKAEVEPKADETPMLALIETPGVPEPTPADQARIVLLDQERFDQFYERVRGETAAHVPDVSTAKGRDDLRALAFRVTKTATTLDKAALDLTAGWRAQVKAVNDSRMPMVDRLKTLAADVRKPLTDWEAAEATRLAANRATIDAIRTDAQVVEGDTAASVEERGRRVWALTFEPPQWSEDEIVEADDAKRTTVAALVAAKGRLAQEQADREELARLRAEAAERAAREEAERVERERVEAEQRAEREAVELREREAAEAERARLAEIEAAAERERQAEARATRAAEEAREAERQRVEREAQAERERIAAEHERELREAREARDLAERQAQEERDRAEQERREREATAERERLAEEGRQRQIRIEADRAAEEERKRQANRQHRTNVQREVKEAIMTCGVSEEHARAIVLAIVGQAIPHVAITF